MLLVIDNYDSFTYNLVQYLLELGQELDVRRNDKVMVAEIKGLDPTGIVISPDRARPMRPGCRWRLCESWVRPRRYWACAWGISALAKRTGGT